MNFRKVNNITGWVVCAIASLCYILTAEKSGSFWDCGEFVSAAFKVQMPHPPGAPLFVLLGRFFIILFGNDANTAAKAVNVMNALASGFTILFLFWTVTHFARKLMVGINEEPDRVQTWTIMGAGIVGGLAYTFSDSFWFSAVEGEVYAFSSFFTGLIFWAMLKWERASDAAGADRLEQSRADRWIIFIAFMMGLSIGVHLLGLLTIPAIVMVYYYKRYNYTRTGAIWAFIIGCIITGIVQVVVIQYSIKLAGDFDIFFVNSLSLPFFSGFVFFFLLLAALIWFGIRWANRRGWSYLRLGLWAFSFMMLGYSTYVTTMERSNANPAIDMNNVDNPMNLVYYLGRDQYGSQPLLYGPKFTADYKYDENGYPVLDNGEMKYTKGTNGKYVPIGRDQEPTYDAGSMMLFPRVWDRSNDQYHADFYGEWLGLQQSQDQRTGQVKFEDPSYGDNINWFFTYQMSFMYWRYFMWNFTGKQNDIQGFGNKRDGNWITGISIIDNARLGDQSKIPASIRDKKGTNKMLALPFLLGVLGCVYQYLRNRKDWVIAFLLFFMTGLAIVIYLNQPGNQPRERDYAYAGSFYAYAIWIGLAVVGIVQMVREWDGRKLFQELLVYGGVTTFIVTLLSCFPAADFASLMVPPVALTILYAIIVAATAYITRAIADKGNNLIRAGIVATALCIVAPVIMGFQEWDDHDRSQKTLAPDIARDYLESCAPNAILFTFGDNDTYPLWYAQEVEGVRPDIRIINNSLLGIDWYINQLRYKINQSYPIDVIWTPEQIQGHNREYLRYQAAGNKDQFYDLYDVMKNVIGQGENANSFPVKKFSVPVDTAYVRKSGVVNPTDTITSPMLFQIPDNNNDLTRSDLTILNIIAANHWKRPIYFTSPFGSLGFEQYIRKDGLSYRLLPIKNSFPQQNWVVDQALRQARMGGTPIRDNNTDVMYKNLMQKFRFGGAEKLGTYFDEENRRHLLGIRSTYAEAAGNMADLGRKQEALNLLNKVEQGVLPQNLSYAMTSRYNSHNQTSLIYLEAAYKAGDTQLADKLKAAINKDLQDQKNYYEYLKNEREDLFKSITTEYQINDIMVQVFNAVVQKYAPSKTQVIEHPGKMPAQAADSSHK